jgi:galactokinase
LRDHARGENLILRDAAREALLKQYGQEQAKTFTAPARVNLIGEHTDYTGGLVFPMAISFTTVASIKSVPDQRYTFSTDLFPQGRTMALDDRSAGVNDWSDYPVGVLRELQALGVEPPPFALHLSGDVPFGAGLSSSASVEVATAMALLAHSGASLSTPEIALLCQRAENNYVHSPCGIMDQFVVTAAKAHHALLLHTRDLREEQIPMNRGELAETCIVICNSMVKHSIAAGDYGNRRRELEQGQAILRETFRELRDLGDASLEQLQQCEANMSTASFQRCRHVISENQRTLQASHAMTKGEARYLGELMTASHASQRDDFACSCEEIDFLVKTAIDLRGCFGARLTGGGFGGCTVNLVAKADADEFVSALREAYGKRYDISAEIYVCEAVDGAVERARSQATAAAKEHA